MIETLVSKECNCCEQLKFQFINYKGKLICLHCWKGFRDEQGRIDHKKLDEALSLNEGSLK
jgi:hypothetical protein